MRSHVLVVGGTGMLRGASLHFLERSAMVSVVASRAHTLADLARSAGPLVPRLNPIQIDYGDRRTFRTELERARETFGPFSLAVSWIHSSAPHAPQTVVDVLNMGPGPCRYFEVVGSATVDPLKAAQDRARRCENAIHVLYRRIVLGFIATPGRSRWLSDDEIASGVVRAVEHDLPCHVVGTLEPWAAHP